jgi:pimeloyl-ACP methyl ester carboxylesterase
VPRIQANGIEIAYEAQGAGPPLVLLHGATSVGRDDFAAQLPLFSKAFRCYLPDARAHGATRWDAADGFRYDWLVDDLVGFVDGLGLDTFHLVGFSMGAMTALQYASRHPARLRTMTIVGITTEREPRLSVLRRLTNLDRVDREDAAWAAVLARRHDEGQGVGAWRRLLPAITGDVARQPLLSPRDLHSIDAPSLVVCGDRDPFVPVEHASGIRRQLRDGRLFVAPECGHEVMSRKPSLFNEALAGFFRSTEPVARRRADAASPESSRRREHATTGVAAGMNIAPAAGNPAAGGIDAVLPDNPLAAGAPDLSGSGQDWINNSNDQRSPE